MSSRVEKVYDGHGIEIVRVETPGREPIFKMKVWGMMRTPPHPQMNSTGKAQSDWVELDVNQVTRFMNTMKEALEGK